MIKPLFAPVKVPEMATPLRRINVSLQAGMAIAVVRTHASSADFVLILEVIFMRSPLLETCASITVNMANTLQAN
jgi:hypothetical protein